MNCCNDTTVKPLLKDHMRVEDNLGIKDSCLSPVPKPLSTYMTLDLSAKDQLNIQDRFFSPLGVHNT